MIYKGHCAGGWTWLTCSNEGCLLRCDNNTLVSESMRFAGFSFPDVMIGCLSLFYNFIQVSCCQWDQTSKHVTKMSSLVLFLNFNGLNDYWSIEKTTCRLSDRTLQPYTPVLTPLFYFHGLTSTAVYWMTYTTQSPSLPALSILLLGHVQLAIPKTLSLIRPAIIHSSGLDLANKSHWAFSDFFSLLSSATAAVFLNSVSPSASLTLSRVSTVTISARPPHWTWQPAICMPDHFSSSLGLFLALIPPLPLSLSLC